MKWIYLMKMETDCEKFHKIGITKKDPKLRLKQLQTGNVFEIELVYQIECEMANKVESSLHNLYSFNRVSGEWFEMNDEQVEDFPNVCEKVYSNLLLMKEQNTYFQEKNKDI